ncbi:hypothetical protein [Alkalicoccobacillus plakortidis]|uniref:Loader and inhibitor of G40P protein n=1 Tax=Alkalicoccobacillus plakortidis TaxID=444060 RepID=A0ABT0XDS1_9BACI|nr:hypothetical protein [Alkalicoccobacillus plakortidis]MCM2674061.1 hypothetical protein [Alkalicoccobacillus plakortidis]
MESEQASEILQMISEVYPRWELTETKLKALVPVLKKMDYQGVLDNLYEHIASKPFAPTMPEIAAYPKQVDQTQEKIKSFEREAEKNPPTPEQRQVLKARLEQFMRKDDSDE